MPEDFGVKVVKEQNVEKALGDISENQSQQDLKRFFLVILSGIIAVCYGVGMFYAGRATEPTPEPRVYVINENQASTTTIP